MRLVLGWFLIGISYAVTFLLTFYLAWLLHILGLDIVRYDLYLAFFLLTVPYIIGGIYARKMLGHLNYGWLWLSLIPTLFEKGFIFFTGWYLYKDRFSEVTFMTILRAIQHKPAPYFTITYITLGVAVSMTITLAVSRLKFDDD